MYLGAKVILKNRNSIAIAPASGCVVADMYGEITSREAGRAPRYRSILL